MNNTVYTYDVWDTLLKRNCVPEYTLELSLYWLLIYLGQPNAYKEIYNKLKNKESENFKRKEEYFIDEVLFNILIKQKIVNDSSKNDVCNTWNEIYYFVEKNCTYRNTNIVDLLDKDNGDKLFISDFYTDSDFIKKLLKHHNVNLDYGITSAEYGASKYSGVLFGKIDILRMKKWIHTGDNKIADVRMAKLEGAEVRFVKSNKKKKVKYKIKNDYERLAFIILSFSLFILATAREKKCKKIYFFTREGVFFKKAFDLLCKEIPNIFSLLETEILPISRVASLALRFNESDEFLGFKDAITQYGSDLSTFLSFFNLKEKHHELVKKFHDVKAILSNQHDPLVRNLINDIADKKNRAEAFLASINFDAEPSVIVDIGWRGSIQDSLMSRASNQIQHGCYLGLFEFYPGQLDRKKSAIIFDNNKGNKFEQKWTRKGVAFMETIFNAMDGSVVDYINNRPMRKNNDCETDSFKTLSVSQDYIIEEYSKIIVLLRCGHIQIGDVNNLAVESYKKLVTNPSREIADFYLESIQNESFGLNSYIEKKFDVTILEVLHSALSRIKRNELKTKLYKNGWRESILKSSKVSVGAKLFSLIVR